MCKPEDVMSHNRVHLKGGLGEREVTPLVLVVHANTLRIGCGRRVLIEGKWYWTDLTISSFTNITHWAEFNRPDGESGETITDVVVTGKFDNRNVIRTTNIDNFNGFEKRKG